MRILTLVLAALFLVPQDVVAQDVPLADPGDVVTVTVDPPHALTMSPDSLGRITLAYATEVAGGVRMIGKESGSFTWERGETPRFPVTLRIPDRAEAGQVEVALVAFETRDGRIGTVPVRVRVRATRRVEVQLVGTREAAGRGESVEFSYVLANMGNAGDSVALSIETNLGDQPGLIPAAVWLAPYEERTGGFDISVPTDAVVGSEVYVRLSAVLEDISVTAHSTVAVLPEKGLFPNLVQIPSTVFLGSTVTASGGTARTQPVAAATGSGKLGQETEVLFSYRYMPRGGSVYAFRGLLSGPRMFVGVQRPDWGAALGDLSVWTSDLLGFQLQGRGLQGTWRKAKLSVQGLAARPTGINGNVLDGHVASAEIGFGTPTIRGAVLGASTERSDEIGAPESSVQAALARFQGTHRGHLLAVDAGPMKVSNLGTLETEFGPSVDARYAYEGRRSDVDIRFRKLPDLLADPRLPPNELRAVGSIRPTRSLTASATLFNEAVPRSLQFAGTRARGVRAGLRWGESAWAIGVTGSARRVEGVVDETRRLGRLDATLRAGDFTFDGSIGLGTTRIANSTELAELYRIGGSWLAEDGMVTFHVTVSDDILQPASTLLDAYGLYRISEVIELYGSATTFVVLEAEGFAPISISDGLTVQTGARFRVAPNRSLYAGIERFSTGGTGEGRWRLSVGIQQGLPLPLPLRRPPAAAGIVFEDLNGNGTRDANEPGLDGVMLRMGFERSVSRPDGRFEFRDAQPGAIEVDPRSIGDSYVPVPAVRVSSAGETAIGLYRPGSLRITLFLDSNNDEVWDDQELPAAAVTLAVTRDDEPWVIKTGADGSVSLSSLAPGTYVIRVESESLPSRALQVEIRSAEVRGGEATELHIPVPMRKINFSQFGDASETCGTGTVSCDDD
jgi:hypothetical protein